MTGRVQSIRSNVSGTRPTGRQPGELYVNWADGQIGSVNSVGGAQDLVAVRFFNTAATYVIGDFVVQGGQLYRAVAPSSGGAFVPTNWTQLGGSITIGDTAPANPQPGQLWWDSVGGQLYVWYADANTAQWVIAVNVAGAGGGGSASITINDTAPASPKAGALWFDSVGAQLYVFFTDANSSQWVPTSNQLGGGYASTAYVDASRLGDNRIINGDMRIDQRNNGASVAGAASGIYTVDRWGYYATVAAKGSCQQVKSAAAQGFQYVLGFTSSSAYTLLAADQFLFIQAIEADTVCDFGWGTASAQPVTLSFWAQSSLTGAFSGAIRNAAGTRSYPFSFSLPVVNTFTKCAITIPGDTAGAWALQGNAAAMSLVFDLGVGSTYRGPANAWTSAPYISGVTGSQSVVSTNAATFYLTGVKLEIGTVATPYNRQSLAKSLADCQRYYQNIPGSIIIGGYHITGGIAYSSLSFSPMRATPTFVFSTPTNNNCSALTLWGTNAQVAGLSTTITTTGSFYTYSGASLSAEL